MRHRPQWTVRERKEPSIVAALTLSHDSATTAGVLLLAVVGVEYGGTFVLRAVRGRVPLTTFQRTFSRAGHAHAGVLVILSLVVQLYADAAGLHGVADTLARSLVPLSAILIPGGFFFSLIGHDRTTPNRWIALLWVGVVALAVGVVALGIGLLTV
jgi:hypothetical protein